MTRRRALLSVSDKTGLGAFAAALVALEKAMTPAQISKAQACAKAGENYLE